MASASLYAKILRDNKASPTGTGFSDVDLKKDCLPLSCRSVTGGQLEKGVDVLEQLKAALGTEQRSDSSKYFLEISEWVRHFLVYAYAAAGTGQLALHASLSHLNVDLHG